MKIVFVLFAAMLITSCKPEERILGAEETPWRFLAATETPSSLKLIEQPDATIIQNDAYFDANGETFPLVTKFVEFSDALYLLKKDTSEIEIVDKITFKKRTTISTTGNPIDIAFANATTAYVVNSGINSVDVVDIYSNKVAFSVTVGKNPVAVAAIGNQVYVANRDENTLSVIDTRANIVVTTIPVHTAPIFLVSHTAQGEVIALSLGGGKSSIEGETPSSARVTFIDTTGKKIINEIPVYDVARDSLKIIPLGLAVTEGIYPYVFIPLKNSLLRVDARRHNGARRQNNGEYSGIQYNFKRQELILLNQTESSTKIVVADETSGGAKSTTMLPFATRYIIPF